MKDNRNVITIIFSTISLIASIVALSVALPRAELAVDYLGVLVAIIGAFATLLLAMQLYNVFNLKEDAKKVADAKDIIEKYADRLDKLNIQLTKAESEINVLNDVASDLMEKSEHAIYYDNDGPCDDK